ncbi:MAG: hypothetical protein ABEI39_02795 [Halobacteriales archaeon]
MNSSPSSKLLALVAVLVIAAGAAGAVSVSQESAPDSARVGETVSATITLTELYQDPNYQQWTLQGQTDLNNVTWTVQTINQAGEVVETKTYDGSPIQHGVNIQSGASKIRVKITGEVPEISNYSYDPEHEFLFAGLVQLRSGGTADQIETFRTHHYTNDSRQARSEIEQAERAINTSGGNQQARDTLSNAVSAYEAENFDNAIDLANEAERIAKSAQQSQQRTQLILMGLGAVVVIGLLVGLVYWYRANQTASKL